MMYGRGYDWGYGMMGGGLLGGILMLVFWALIVAGIVALVVWLVRTAHLSEGRPGSAARPEGHGRDEACEIARRRFASGEITKDEFDEMMCTLEPK